MKVKLKFEVDLSDSNQKIALDNLLNAMAGGETSPVEAKKTVVPPPTLVKKKTVVPPTPAKVEEAEEEESEDEEGTTLEEVRALIKATAGKHLAAIKAKLTKLGAENASSLDPKKFPEMVKFLNGLA